MVGLKTTYFAIYPLYGSTSSYKIALRFSPKKLNVEKSMGMSFFTMPLAQTWHSWN